ncbi:hypothetical protein BDV95DRAFT_602619 [Massariosphaeria phaeospora]|uniref:Uncharacterized protein n=1 Tax=Massariosphaeria phaeospora TaxID=100035 RepID=A0A7C8ID78_9PLEO|nr:hypothetical protein BDV95DRAFT_602619 [Massariosphaeria phaeospora]
MRSTITALLTAFAALASAAPQSGGGYVAVGYKYSGGGCTESSLIFGDPIFGNGNVCQPLDRFGDNGPIVSYKTLSASGGCTVKLYTDAGCTSTAFSAPVGGCVQANSPFVSAFVTCVR